MYLFERVLVNTLTPTWTEIVWAVDRRFPYAQPWTFQPQWAPHADTADEEWEDVGSPTALTTAIDPVQRYYSKQPDSVYRVRLSCADGVGYSDPVRALGSWNKKEYLLAREICRREYLMLKKYTGTEGKYFARRRSGTKCPVCLDWNTGEVINSECEVCFGVGLTGGYYPASTVWIGEDNVSSRIQTDPNAGQKNDQTQKGRMVAYPQAQTEDFWANPTTGERWFLQTIAEAAAVRGIPLVWNVELRLAPADSPVYSLPLDWNGGLGSSSSP